MPIKGTDDMKHTHLNQSSPGLGYVLGSPQKVIETIYRYDYGFVYGFQTSLVCRSIRTSIRNRIVCQ